jgi:HK97 family phage prohead protease
MRIFIKSKLDAESAVHCSTLIAAGAIDKSGAFIASADVDAKWFLGEGKKYAFGKDGKVFRSALVAIRSKAALCGDDTVFYAAGMHIDEIDGTKNYSGKKSLAMKQRCWAKFECKAVTENDTHYLLSGTATTPTPDKAEDIIEPMGGDYELPMPFLWQHDHLGPVGEVYEATPSAKGIPVSVRIPKVTVAGKLKDRIDEAVQSIQHNLVKGLSIGFAPIEYSYIEDTGGYRFIKWLWLELSAVTIPCNGEATITNIKSFDAKSRPSHGRKRVSVDLRAGVSADEDEQIPREIRINVRSK